MKQKYWSPWEGMVIKHICPECKNEMRLVDDGIFHPYLVCVKCGHEEVVK